jgi:hypothetical protein
MIDLILFNIRKFYELIDRMRSLVNSNLDA